MCCFFLRAFFSSSAFLHAIRSPCSPHYSSWHDLHGLLHTVTIDLSYTLNEVVTSGSQTVTLKYDGLQVSDKTVDLCTGGVLANDTKVPCPTPAAPFKGSSSTTITPPEGAPAGTYIGRQTWEDQNGDQILCLAYVLSVSSGGLNQTNTSITNKK